MNGQLTIDDALPWGPENWEDWIEWINNPDNNPQLRKEDDASCKGKPEPPEAL